MFYCLLDLSCSECDVMSLYCMCCSVNESVCLVCCVFVNCVVKQFSMCLGALAILLMNVMEVFSVVGGSLLDRPCMVFQRMCVLCMWSQCASRCSFHMFCSFVIVCRKVTPHLRVWELDHICLLSLCCLCVFRMLCGRVRAYAACPLA